MSSNPTQISKDDYIDILLDKKLTRDDDLKIFQTIFSLENHEGSATEIAKVLGWSDKATVVGKIVGVGMRAVKKFNFQQRQREDGSLAYWDLFFDGYQKGTFFIYQLKPNLKEAVEEINLSLLPKAKETQNPYLFIWNPKRWSWENLEEKIKEIDFTGKCKERWSCGNSKNISINDRIFLMRVGEEPKGIMASGYAISKPYKERHWGDGNKDALYVDVEFEILFNPDKEPILMLDVLEQGSLKKQHWTPQASGTFIKSEIVDELESVWFEFITTQNVRFNPFIQADGNFQSILKEGNALQVLMTRYERNPYARKLCINHYGYSCVVCDFNFEKHYGKIGYSFIHVHHLVHLASQGTALQ